MKGWQVAALVVLLVVGAVVVMRPKQAAAKTTQSPNTSNDTFSSFAALGAALGGKLLAPSASSTRTVVVPNEGTYRTDTTPTIQGNTLVDQGSGKVLTYGTD